MAGSSCSVARSLRRPSRKRKQLQPFGLDLEILDDAGIRAMEPHISEGVRGGIHFKDPVYITDPGALSRAYLHLFEQRGGAFLPGDAKSLEQANGHWTVKTESGVLTAADVVVALGPWADIVYEPLGYELPLAVKRGYHMHYRPAGNAVLNHTRARRRERLRAGADGARHPPHHRRGIRRSRRAADSRADRARPSRMPAGCSRWTGSSIPSRGWEAGPARPTCCRSSAPRPIIKDCGSPSATRIMG